MESDSRVGLEEGDLNDPELLKELAALGAKSKLMSKDKSYLVKKANEPKIEVKKDKSSLVRDKKKLESIMKKSKVVKNLEERIKWIDEEISGCDKGIGQYMKTDKDKAREFVKRKNELRKEREELIKNKSVKPKVTRKDLVKSLKDILEYDIEKVEDVVHDIDKMLAKSVLMEESNVEASEEEHEVYLSRKAQVDLKCNMKMSDIESGFIPF